MEKQRTCRKIRIHDGIVGILYLVSAVLAFAVSPEWLYLTAGIALLQISSYFTGFCPVYYLLDHSEKKNKTEPAGTSPV